MFREQWVFGALKWTGMWTVKYGLDVITLFFVVDIVLGWQHGPITMCSC